MERTDKKSKKKLLVVLKNRSKKLRTRTNNEKTEKRELEYIQKGGADYAVTLYSNYTFTKAPVNVDDKLIALNAKTDNTKLDNIAVFFTKCVNFLTDDDFAPLYLKSNFSINAGRTNTNINTSSDTLLNFQSLILLEMCYRLLGDDDDNDSISPGGILFQVNNTPIDVKANIFLNELAHFKDEDENNKKKTLLLLVFSYRLFKHFIDDTEDKIITFRNLLSTTKDYSVPLALILLNYIIDEFTEKNRQLIEAWTPEHKTERNKYKEIGHNFISYFNTTDGKKSVDATARNTYFDGKKAMVETYKTNYLIPINKKFEYTYEEAKAWPSLFEFFITGYQTILDIYNNSDA